MLRFFVTSPSIKSELPKGLHPICSIFIFAPLPLFHNSYVISTLFTLTLYLLRLPLTLFTLTSPPSQSPHQLCGFSLHTQLTRVQWTNLGPYSHTQRCHNVPLEHMPSSTTCTTHICTTCTTCTCTSNPTWPHAFL